MFKRAKYIGKEHAVIRMIGKKSEEVVIPSAERMEAVGLGILEISRESRSDLLSPAASSSSFALHVPNLLPFSLAPA